MLLFTIIPHVVTQFIKDNGGEVHHYLALVHLIYWICELFVKIFKHWPSIAIIQKVIDTVINIFTKH